MHVVLFICLAAGSAALIAGLALRHRRVRAEHWLWKKRRLFRARLLMGSGFALTVTSAAAMVVA